MDARADLSACQDEGYAKEGTAERYDKRLYKAIKRVEDLFRPIVEEIEELEQTQSDRYQQSELAWKFWLPCYFSWTRRILSGESVSGLHYRSELAVTFRADIMDDTRDYLKLIPNQVFPDRATAVAYLELNFLVF